MRRGHGGGGLATQIALDKEKSFANILFKRPSERKFQMISAEELLKPISEANPCGENLEYDPAFVELDTLILGKPETQFSKAEDPDWRMLHQRCLELSARSKDLRLATRLCLSGMKLDGLPAL